MKFASDSFTGYRYKGINAKTKSDLFDVICKQDPTQPVWALMEGINNYAKQTSMRELWNGDLVVEPLTLHRLSALTVSMLAEHKHRAEILRAMVQHAAILVADIEIDGYIQVRGLSLNVRPG